MDVMTKLWCNFAKYGNPNGSDDVPESKLEGFTWEKSTFEKPARFLKICLEPKMMDEYHEGRPLFWLEVQKQAAK
uniref:COesterase domain-containing protein n=1 Tax=Steinernema glaseri TaxID=37863 RepID=A0A1I7YA51_9BILA